MLETIIVSAVVLCAVIAVAVLVMVLRSVHASDDNTGSVASENKNEPDAGRENSYEALSDEVELTKVLSAGHRINNAGLPIRLKNLKTSRSSSLIVCPELIIGRMEIDGVFTVQGDAAISKKHCRLYMDGGRLWLEDMHSVNHTFLNGQRIDSPVPVKSGDELRVGNSRLMIFF